jgi:hypothetical protein
MAWTIFHKFLEGHYQGSAVDFENDTIKVMLIDNVRAPSQSSDANMVSIDNNEVKTSGAQYTAGGATLANATVALSTGTVTIDADDVTWSQSASSGFTSAYYGVMYKSVGAASADIPIAYESFGSAYSNTSGSFTLEMSASGMITITES